MQYNLRNPSIVLIGTVAVFHLTSCATSANNTLLDPTLLLNQTGFETGAAQAATLRTNAISPAPWTISDATGQIIRTGQTEIFGFSSAAGETVHILKIAPPISELGQYSLSVSGATTSEILIQPNRYTDLAVDSLKYFYLNRAGTEIERRFTRDDHWAREPGHPEEIVTCFSGTDKTGLKWPGCTYKLDVTGGWYDAGDHGKYVVNGGISAWTLQNAAERLLNSSHTFSQKWNDGRANIPESGNDVSDILDEARWETEFLLSMQVPNGKMLELPLGAQSVADGQKLTLTRVNASGLVHHKVHGNKWPPFPLQPKDDTEPRYLFPPSTAATLNLAAVAAQAARLWKGVDDEFAERCLEAAKTAYEAATKHQNIFAYNVFDGGGPYTDTDLSDEFAWAATELYATTGDRNYISNLSQTLGVNWLERVRSGTTGDVSWGNVDQLPAATMLASKSFSDADRSRSKDILIGAADRYLSDAAKDGYGVPFPATGYGWGSNGAVAARSLALGYAFDTTGDPKYRNGIIASLDYLLGRNPLGQSYIAGFGTNSAKHVHHRYWGQGADPAFPPAAPGALSGGPNASYPTSEYETAEIGPCAPQLCWVDDHNGFSINEVAINWNAALFWLTSFLDTTPQQISIIGVNN